MARIRKIDKRELKKWIKKYVTENRSDIQKLAKASKIDQSTIYNVLNSWHTFRSTIDKLEAVGIILTKQGPIK